MWGKILPFLSAIGSALKFGINPLNWISIFSTIKSVVEIFNRIDESRRAKREKENQDAVTDDFKDGDTRRTEAAIGSGNAGKPAVIRDGVQERPKRDRS